MTYFDSKRYFSAQKMMPFYKIRSFFLPTNMEQQEVFDTVLQYQSVRYTCLINGPIFEEQFELIDGRQFIFRYRLMKPDAYDSFLKELLGYYGYAYGGVLKHPPKETIQKTIEQTLLQNLRFTYEQNTLVYRKKETEFYIMANALKEQNFVLRIFEKEEYDAIHKEELIDTIHELIQPILSD